MLTTLSFRISWAIPSGISHCALITIKLTNTIILCTTLTMNLRVIFSLLTIKIIPRTIKINGITVLVYTTLVSSVFISLLLVLWGPVSRKGILMLFVFGWRVADLLLLTLLL